MKRFIVIESDSERYGVYVYEVTREFTSDSDINKGVAYHRSPSGTILVSGPVTPKFYGKLDALLVTRDKVETAPPIVPELPLTPLEQAAETLMEKVERVQGPVGMEVVSGEGELVWDDGCPIGMMPYWEDGRG